LLRKALRAILPVLPSLLTAAALCPLRPSVPVAATTIAAPAFFFREPSAVRVVPAASHACAAWRVLPLFNILYTDCATCLRRGALQPAKGGAPRYNHPLAAAAILFASFTHLRSARVASLSQHPSATILDQARSAQ
jgi:hypothetical protein